MRLEMGFEGGVSWETFDVSWEGVKMSRSSVTQTSGREDILKRGSSRRCKEEDRRERAGVY